MSSPSSVSEKQPGLNLQNRKRSKLYDITQDSPPAKRIKSTSAVRVASNFPPKFWDSLSKVWLTPRALREKDRRKGAQHPATVSAASVTPTTLARFARRGGPDLGHLRGYPEPKDTARMSSNRSSAPSSRRTQSTKATTVSSKAKRSSAYDKDFEQNLIDHKIFPKGYEYSDDDLIPEPSNLDDIVEALAAPRASLSPSQFPRSRFKTFALANDRVISEGKVMSGILPMICGNADIPNEGNLAFTNLDSITDGTTVDAVPDLYDGSLPKDINKKVRQELNKKIIPTSHGRAPVVPNFFVEAKAPRGGADVAKRQACLDGAIGARAMHHLQSYGEDVLAYDGNAHTFSSTYHAGTGTLQLYAHHVTGPATEGERPEYHMTQLDGWQMTGNISTFRRGATAFRNARDLACRQRQSFIKEANTRASQLKDVATKQHTIEIHQDKNSDVPISHAEATSWREFHDDLQHHIAENCVGDHEYNREISTTPEHHYTSDESQGLDQDLAASGTDDPSMSFMSSFTSTFSIDTIRPKRSRQSFTSPTQGSRLPKSRSRPSATQRSGGSSKAATETDPTGPPESCSAEQTSSHSTIDDSRG
ncbi:hypothetical protein BBAD15_g5105 [Beauveria bassiana D1-5]|uniref:Uncharacterized protein n=1 Tax=Beauveria bassiana D1-5 TaxID=1245745 RepID=A0A0A2W994_BEABA|nr:hypothetical protein BBAD15_g5105 [Beauveria bassiana D1-5]